MVVLWLCLVIWRHIDWSLQPYCSLWFYKPLSTNTTVKQLDLIQTRKMKDLYADFSYIYSAYVVMKLWVA